MNQTLFKRLETAGGAVVYAIAAFLHFFYDFTGGSIVGALFGAVNESVWEHLKIFAIAYIIWAVTELLWAKPNLKKFVSAKAVGLYSLCTTITLFFYLYTAVAGRAILAVDLISSLVFSFGAHYVSYKLTLSDRNRGQFFYTSVMLIFLALIMILCFSYYPPACPLFKDYTTGLYGVIPQAADAGAAFLSSQP